MKTHLFSTLAWSVFYFFLQYKHKEKQNKIKSKERKASTRRSYFLESIKLFCVLIIIGLNTRHDAAKTWEYQMIPSKWLEQKMSSDKIISVNIFPKHNLRLHVMLIYSDSLLNSPDYIVLKGNLDEKAIFFNGPVIISGVDFKKLWCHLCWRDDRRDNLPCLSTCHCLWTTGMWCVRHFYILYIKFLTV